MLDIVSPDSPREPGLAHSYGSPAQESAALTYLIDAHNLERSFGPTLAVRGVSLQVMPGQIMALLGPNGAGKTTTLQMLAGLLPPTAGEARVAGYDIQTDSNKVRARVGLMVDEPGFYPEMTVEEYLLFVTRLYRVPSREARATMQELMERFMLIAKRRARLSALSKGMRQKVALIRAVIHRPPVLLLDEPTSALDPLAARAVHTYIRERRALGDAIIISTHDLLEAELLSDRVAIIASGRLCQQGTCAELCRAPDGRELFSLTLGGAPQAATDTVLKDIPGLSDLTHAGATETTHMISYRTTSPEHTNALLTATLARHNVAVLGLTLCPESLSAVYLRAMEEG